jgi:hypothetical protein
MYHVYDRLLEGFIAMDLPSKGAADTWINEYCKERPESRKYLSVCPPIPR